MNASTRATAPARPSPARTLAKIGLILLLIEGWVRGPFLANFVLLRYADSARRLRDPTVGHNLSIFFDRVTAVPRDKIRIAFLGDSTMAGVDVGDTDAIPVVAVDSLRQRMGSGDFKAVDGSQIGLYGGDAALFAAKLLGRGIDVLAYGVCPRAFPSHPEDRWVTRVSSQLGVGEIWRLARAGGTRWLLANLSAEHVLGGLVNANWATYAYRGTLRDALRKQAIAPLVARWGYTDIARWVAADAVAAAQTPIAPPPTSPRPKAASYEWTFEGLGYPNANWEALELIGRLCERYLPGRCVIYAVPINPAGWGDVAEPGLYEDYLAHVSMIAGRHGLIFRDFTNALTPEEFLPPNFPRRYDPMHPNRAGRLKFAPMLTDALLEATRNVMSQATARRHD
jgi:hypothetical protein